MRHIQDRGFFHRVNFLEQLIDQFEISFLVGLLHLATEFLYIAIGLSLGLVATLMIVTTFCASSLLTLAVLRL